MSSVSNHDRNRSFQVVPSGMSLRGIEILESFDCHRFNGICAANLSEHGHAKTSCPLIVASLLVLNAGSGNILGLIALPVQIPLY